MKRSLLLFAVLNLAAPQAANAETIYLIINHIRGGVPAITTVPMESFEQCEEAGAIMKASKRWSDSRHQTGYECLAGK